MASNAKSLAELIAADSSIDVANTDITGLITGEQLAPTGVTPGIYGGASAIGALCIDDKGRITSASNVAVTTGLPPYSVNCYNSPTTWTRPGDLDFVYVSLRGGGGGGGGGGGAGVPNPGSSGNPGQSTTFGAYATATAGAGGAGGVGRPVSSGNSATGACGNSGAAGSFSSPVCALSSGILLTSTPGDFPRTSGSSPGGAGGGRGVGKIIRNQGEDHCTRGGSGGCGGTGGTGTMLGNAPQIPGPVALTIGSRGNGGAAYNSGCNGSNGLVSNGNTGGVGQCGSAILVVYDA